MVSAEPESANAKLTFFVKPTNGARPYTKAEVDPKTGERDHNYGREEKDVVIENLRGKEDSVSLDLTGFQYFKHASKHTLFASDEEIKKEYYPESIELIKKLTGASRVVLFDHTVRRRNPGLLDGGPGRRQPAPQVHVDQSSKAAVARVHHHLPASEASELLKHRFQIINLWRPISHPALDWPLALCDYRSVNPEKDTVPVALVYPDREGETLGVNYSENYKWKYLRGMRPDEVLLIKCFDSQQDGSVSVFTPHTGFQDPTTPEGAPLRESIELRALVFYD